jgi:hypothetical protein
MSADQSPNKEVSRFKARGNRDSSSWVAADHTPRGGVIHRPTPYVVGYLNRKEVITITARTTSA